MADRPPFDPLRAAFLLVATVIGVHCVVVLMFAGACLMHSSEIVTVQHVDCDPNSRMMSLLAAVLAAALAFAGVSRNKDK